jgi:hypothetical protein
MSNGDTLSAAVRDLKQWVYREQSVENLRQFVLEIDKVLDLVEARLTQLEGDD